VAGELDRRAGQLDAGRAGADHDEGEQAAPLGLVGGDLGALEGEQQAAADLGRVLDRLEAGRDGRPFVVAEVGVRGARGEHQRVIRDDEPLGVGAHQPRRGVDLRDLGQHDGDVALAAEDRPRRPGDVARRERGGGDLVEQRLEQVVVVAVQQRDLGRGPGQRPRRLQPAEAGAEDHHAQRLRFRRRLRHPQSLLGPAPRGQRGAGRPVQATRGGAATAHRGRYLGGTEHSHIGAGQS
jgi:hypothetical protein